MMETVQLYRAARFTGAVAFVTGPASPMTALVLTYTRGGVPAWQDPRPHALVQGRDVGSPPARATGEPDVIDTLRNQIQDRRDQLVAEAEKLREALAALDPGGHQAPTRDALSRTGRRTSPGATRSRVLATLSDSKARTAGEIAVATGLARETVSSILGRLAKTGEVCGADRGYTLANGRGAETAAGAAPTPSAAS